MFYYIVNYVLLYSQIKIKQQKETTREASASAQINKSCKNSDSIPPLGQKKQKNTHIHFPACYSIYLSLSLHLSLSISLYI